MSKAKPKEVEIIIPPISLPDVPLELLKDPGIKKREKFKFNKNSITNISNKVKALKVLSEKDMKLIEKSLSDLRTTAEKLAKSDFGEINTNVTISVPPRPSKINNFIKVDDSLIEASSKYCKFEIPKQIKLTKKSTKRKSVHKDSESHESEDENNSSDTIKTPNGLETGISSNVLSNLMKMVNNLPSMPDVGKSKEKGQCMFENKFKSELSETKLSDGTIPKASEFKGTLIDPPSPSSTKIASFSTKPVEISEDEKENNEENDNEEEDGTHKRKKVIKTKKVKKTKKKKK